MFFPCEFVHTRRPLFLINSFSYICLVLSYTGLSSFDVLFFFFLQVRPRMGVLSLEFVLDRRCSLLWIFLPVSGISQFGALTPSSNEIQYLVFSKHGQENPDWNFCKESNVVFVISVLYLVNLPSRCCYRQILIAKHDANPRYGLTISVSVKVPSGCSPKSQVCCILIFPMEVLSGLLIGRLIPQWVAYSPQMILPKGFSSLDIPSSWHIFVSPARVMMGNGGRSFLGAYILFPQADLCPTDRFPVASFPQQAHQARFSCFERFLGIPQCSNLRLSSYFIHFIYVLQACIITLT